MSADRALEFLDTNVVVYAHDSSAGDKHLRAVELLERVTSDGTGAISVQVLQEFFVTVTRKLQRPLSPRVAAAIIADLGTWVTHAPDVADVLVAIDLQERLQTSFWDAMILCSASRLGCAVLWSEDFASGRAYDDVEARSPFVER